jgi:hypothetical protein
MIFFIKIVMSILVLIIVFNPEFAWKISYSWMFKNVKPDVTYLKIIRIASVIFLLYLWFVI